MADKTSKEAPIVEETTASPAIEMPMHLDDFLNRIVSEERKIESLSAFAALKKRVGEIKKPFSAWLHDFRQFENDIPR